MREAENQLNLMKERCKAAEKHSEDLASQLYYDHQSNGSSQRGDHYK
jgi:uncharacterized protein YkwD